MKAAVIVFPGSNCDHDCRHVLQDVLGIDTTMVWHKERTLPTAELVVLPGGFSYGDYLRAGAIARFAPIMEAVAEHAKRGGLVFGICNGFQILTEAGLLPGALLPNRSLNFICADVMLRTEHANCALTALLSPSQAITMPVAHGEGCYYIDDSGLERLEGDGQVLFRYLEPDGTIAPHASINGSKAAIAGVSNPKRNVFGMMPHPERAAEALIGGPARGGNNTDGLRLFQGLVESAGSKA